MHPHFLSPLCVRRRSVHNCSNIFPSETTWSLKTKLWWNGAWATPFQNCVRQSRPRTNMADVTKNEKGEMKLKKSSSLQLLGQLELNFAYIVLG